MTAKLNSIGQRFGRLTVIKQSENIQLKNGRVYTAWLCKCDCGNLKVVRTAHLRSGNTLSCGCYGREIHKQSIKKAIRACTKHNDRKNPLYGVWAAMKRRCNNPNTAYYELYGGRGISVCKEWNDYVRFKIWAIKAGYKKGLTIDRINCNGNYEPGNCRWITIQEQQRNRRNNRSYLYKGTYYTVREIAKLTGLKVRTIQGRIERNWSIEKVVETPCLIGNGKKYFKKCSR